MIVLSCLVEGSNQHFPINIPYDIGDQPVYVKNLRENVFEDCCINMNENCLTLRLLKVSALLHVQFDTSI